MYRFSRQEQFLKGYISYRYDKLSKSAFRFASIKCNFLKEEKVFVIFLSFY